MHAKMMEHEAKRDPTWEPKSVQNRKKAEKKGFKNRYQKLMQIWRRPGIDPWFRRADFEPAGGEGGDKPLWKPAETDWDVKV